MLCTDEIQPRGEDTATLERVNVFGFRNQNNNKIKTTTNNVIEHPVKETLKSAAKPYVILISQRLEV